MQAESENRFARLLTDLVEFARGRLPAEMFATVEPFLRHYYDLADTEDLSNRELADLYGAAMAHWQTAQKFVSGSARLRVYNPNLEQHGWHSDHTVVEIVNDDMPFLVDSVTMEINRCGLAVHSAIHPVFRIWRGPSGGIERVSLGGPGPDGEAVSHLESFIHFEVDRCGEASRVEELRAGIARILGDVRAAVEDWPQMMEIAQDSIDGMRRGPDSTDAETVEACAFVEWLIDNHFTFLGHRDYQLVTQDGRFFLRGVAGSGAGILRESLRLPAAEDITPLPPAATGIIEGAAP